MIESTEARVARQSKQLLLVLRLLSLKLPGLAGKPAWLQNETISISMIFSRPPDQASETISSGRLSSVQLFALIIH